jgi:hypothetical protein
MKKKVTISSFEAAVLEAAIGFVKTGSNEFTVRRMAETLNKDNAKVVRAILSQMERKRLMKDEGWRSKNQWFSVTDGGCELYSEMAFAMEQKNELKIVEKITHVGIPTTVKEKTISPAPRVYEDGSELNVGGKIGTSRVEADVSYLQKDSKKMEFNKKGED